MNILSLCDGQSCGQVALERAGINVDKYYASEIEENPIKITQYNYPNTIQLGDMTKIDLTKLPKIDLILSGTPCFVAGTKVITNDGYKNIEDIKAGDFVLTHKNRYRKVLNIGSKLAEVNELKAQGIFKTMVTSNHPYYVRSKINGKLNEPQWKKVSDLNKSDYLGIPIIKTEENPYNLTKEQCWILGRYLADGHIRNDKRKERNNSYFYQVILSVGESKIEEFKNRVREQHFSCYKHSQSVYRCVINSKWLVEFIKKNNFGTCAEKKRVPDVIYNLPIELIKEFLNGYLSGDGYKKKEGINKSNSVSIDLTIGLSLLFIKAYKTLSSIYYPNVKPQKIIEGRLVNQQPYYELTNRFYTSYNKRYIVDRDILWTPFSNVKQTGNKEIVYNIEVEEDNSYTANNAIVHNCQGFSRNGKMLNFEDERSKLFFDFSRILKYIKENNNPDVKFLLENVEMKKEWKKIINEELGVEGQLINSKLVSAQSRPRVYWTNIDYEELKDKGCVLKNILEEVDTSNYINHQGILIDPQIKEKSRNLINVVDGEVRISQATKLGYIVANDGDGVNLQFPTSKTRRGRVIKQKSSTLDCGCDVCVYYDNIIRKFTINELEKLQTLPVDYTKCLDNLAARKKAIGNGWTVDVIVHILRGLKNKTK